MNKPNIKSPVVLPIQQIRKGQRVRVEEMRGDADEIARLAEMGIRTGVELCCLQRGCPCIVQCGHSKMCLRPAGRLRVLVSRI